MRLMGSGKYSSLQWCSARCVHMLYTYTIMQHFSLDASYLKS